MSEAQRNFAPGLTSRFAVLESQLSSSSNELAELEIPDLPARTILGLDRSGVRWLSIDCDPKTVAVDDRSAAVQFTLRPNGYRVSLSARTTPSIAFHFLDEIIQLIQSGHPPGEAADRALQGWRELLARPAGAPLSENALVGLFGELEVLELSMRHGGSLDDWTGWNRDHADFRLPGLVIEVKSTTSSDFRRVRIHGLNQLADPQDGSRLVLVLRRLEASPDGRSVPELTDAIVRLGAPRSQLLDRLSTLGYSEQHRPHYENIRFVSQEIALRNIDDAHPRLVPEMLADVDLASIDKIDYELNLNGHPDADLAVSLEELLSTRQSSDD